MRYQKVVVSLCIALAIIFTGVVLYLMATGMPEPAVLIGCFFGFITGELWALASIKKKEVEHNGTDEYSDTCTTGRGHHSSDQADLEQ